MAPETTAPSGSTIVPVMVPRSLWAHRKQLNIDGQAQNRHAANRRMFSCILETLAKLKFGQYMARDPACQGSLEILEIFRNVSKQSRNVPFPGGFAGCCYSTIRFRSSGCATRGGADILTAAHRVGHGPAHDHRCCEAAAIV